MDFKIISRAKSRTGSNVAKSMNADHVSIITRTKDRPLLIRRSIESVLEQTHENWTHIIVNDGGSKEILEKQIEDLSARYRGRLIIIHNPISVGATAALNIGMKEANSSFVTTHDDDDTWQPEFLEKCLVSLAAQKLLIPKTRGIVCHTTIVDEYLAGGDVVFERYRYSFNGWLKTVSLVKMAAENFIPPISMLFEKEVFSELGFFDESVNFGEDWEFYLKFLSKYEIGVFPEHLANYHIRTNDRNGYGNTVTSGGASHRAVSTYLRNELIRRDLAAGKFGLGSLIAITGAGLLLGNPRHRIWLMQKRAIARWNPRRLGKQSSAAIGYKK